MTQYKVGDVIRIEQRDYSFRWYHNKIGQQSTISHIPLHEDYVIVNSDIGEKGVLIEDVSLAVKGEQMSEEQQTDSSTDDAILQLQSLFDKCLDENVAIIITPSRMYVKAFGNEYACASADELEKVCNAVSYLSGMEIV